MKLKISPTYNNFHRSDVSTPDFWDKKYSENEHSWDIGRPTPIFQNWASNIKNKSSCKICIPGCGYGHDVIYLSKLGFDVYGFDFSSKAINTIKKNNKSLNVKCEDFFSIDNSYDTFFDYILEYTFYCAINPQNRLAYVDKCYKLLKDKGKLIAIMLPVANDYDSNGPPFNVTKKELTENFNEKFHLISLQKNKLSIKQRRKIEYYAEYEKK